MSYRNAASRAGSKSPAGIQNPDRGSNLSINTNLPLNVRLNGEASSFTPNGSAMSYLNHGSTPDNVPLIVTSTPRTGPGANAANGGKKMVPSAIGTADGRSPLRIKAYYTTDVKPGHFTGSHYIKVVVDKGSYGFLFDKLHEHFGWHAAVRASCIEVDPESKKMTLWLTFDDVRRAAKAEQDVGLVDTTADVEYATQPEFAAAQRVADAKEGIVKAGPAPSGFYDGQVYLALQYDGFVSGSKPADLEAQVRDFALTFGDVLVLGEIDAKAGKAMFRVEFYSIKAAKNLIKKVTAAEPAAMGSWAVIAEEMRDIVSPTDTGKGTGVAGRGSPASNVTSESTTLISPTGRTAWSVVNGAATSADRSGIDRHSPFNGVPITLRPTRLLPSPVNAQFNDFGQNGGLRHGPMAPGPNYPFMHQQQFTGDYQMTHGRNDLSEHSQAVEIDNIRKGVDVRTTVMLRNLPNQMTCHKLKELLDLCVFGEYDFSYVRIDYEKGASVGYGFVNFTSPEAIIRFLDFIGGKPWMPDLPNPRGARRLAEISYATVQGYDCCVEKFRNSSVMTECPDYRPKLWFTHDSAESTDMVGTEAPFPAVNNPSKHARSLANASQIGLFPPQSRRGQGPQHRSIRSQYDRGTTAQQQEDFMHLMQMQMANMQLTQNGQFHNAQYAGVMVPYAGAMMPPQPGPYGAPPMVDAYGNPVFPGAAMAPNGYAQMMTPPMAAPCNGQAGSHGFRQLGNGPAASKYGMPRTFGNGQYPNNHVNGQNGNANGGQANGFFYPPPADHGDKSGQ